MPASPNTSRASEAVQDYAKAIYALQERTGEPAATSAVAERLGVSAASASAMLKRLAVMGLVTLTPYHGTALTKSGESVALEVIRHHRLLEAYLAEALDMPWDRVHAEAERLEHAISPELSELIADKLGHPTHDPHGDPIPSADGTIDETVTIPLGDMAAGQSGVFTRVSDSDPAMLRYLSDLGIAPGDRVAVVERQPFDGPLAVRFASGEQTLGGDLVRMMRVAVTP